MILMVKSMKRDRLLILLTFILLLVLHPVFADEELLWSNFNTGMVLNGPKLYSGAPMKDDTEPVLITKVRTYHWNNGNGAPAGSISICEDSLDNVIGTWQAVGRSGSGRQNVYWEALVDCVMYPGHNYFVKVSDKSTWSYNEESEGGFFELYGIFPAPEGYVDPARLPNTAAGSPSVGQTFTMGQYEQDNNLSNGPEPIEWEVLTVQGDRALVISKYALDFRPMDDSFTETTWETSGMRKWLNGYFYDQSFTDAEKTRILLVKNENPDNPQYGTDGGNLTQDRIFLLSFNEMMWYMTDESRNCGVTDYARAQSQYLSSNRIFDNIGVTSREIAGWWLRSPGFEPGYYMMTALNTNLSGFGHYTFEYFSSDVYYNDVRPAFWLKISSASAPTATPKPRICYKVTYAGNNCLAQVPTDNKCYQLGDLVTVLFEPVEYMQSMIFTGWDMDRDNAADFGYYYPTFAMPNHDVELKAVCYQQYQNYYDNQYYGVTTGEVDPYYNQQQYYNPYNDPTLNNDIYDPNTGWWFDPDSYKDYYGGVG